jgi:hypothetical protein
LKSKWCWGDFKPNKHNFIIINKAASRSHGHTDQQQRVDQFSTLYKKIPHTQPETECFLTFTIQKTTKTPSKAQITTAQKPYNLAPQTLRHPLNATMQHQATCRPSMEYSISQLSQKHLLPNDALHRKPCHTRPASVIFTQRQRICKHLFTGSHDGLSTQKIAATQIR